MRNKKKLGHLAIAIIVSILSVVIASKNFVIKDITCTTQYGRCPDRFMTKLRPLLGKSALRVPTSTDVDNIFAGFNMYYSATVERSSINTLHVQIRIRVPIGAVKNPNQNTLGLIDETGRVIETVETTNISVLLVDEWNPQIKQLAAIHVKSLQCLEVINKKGFSNPIGQLTSVGLVVNSKQMPTIVIDPKQNISEWDSTLQAIIDRSKIQNKMPKKIDLRFNQPILEY